MGIAERLRNSVMPSANRTADSLREHKKRQTWFEILLSLLSSRPSCGESTGVEQYDRRIGYYELFALSQRPCDKMFPEDLAAGPLTHINLAFGAFDENFNIIDDSGDIIRRTSFLKARYAGLRVNLAIGGWAFNDPPTQNYFSNMASTYPNRQKFISSLMSFLQKYGLDGVDIDWEYPAALDRGGMPADTENYVLLMSEIREAFDATNPGWEATITIPTSFWYLRGFDIVGLEKYVSWFNLMSYDLHGGWDQHNQFTGPYLEGHTNVTEIENGLDLLWRNGILPQNVVMGYAFYGRSFTVADVSCTTPGCVFSTTGRPGDCSETSGILLYDEIVSRNSSLDVQTFYDPDTTVKYNVFDGNQWISYDDEQSFTDKKNFMSSRCLSGLMIWAIDQDTPDYQALAGLIGDGALAGSLLEGGSLDNRSAGALSAAFGAYTGQNCFVTPTCTDGSPGQQTADQVCPPGSISMATAHSPFQAPDHDLHGQCSEGWYRHICCPEENAPKNCQWNGAPIRSEIGCSGQCGSNQFLLNTDPFIDANGDGQCYQGNRNLCCDGAANLERCFWTSCQGPIAINSGDLPTCPPGSTRQTYRYDQDDGDWCSATYVSPLDGSVGSPVHRSFGRAFCCPNNEGYNKCHWSNDPQSSDDQVITNDPDLFCIPHSCSNTETQVTKAFVPPVSPEVTDPDLGVSGGPNGVNCDGVSVSSGFDAEFPYCCEPPSKFSEDWPVDPKFLFSTYYDTADDDVLWHYSDDYPNNDADQSQANPDAEDGTDAYGFVMLDGPPGSLDSEFGSTHSTITAKRDLERPVAKRSIITTDPKILEATFDHVEETVYVYCNYPQDSVQCQKVWHRGAEDTIIKLPDHVGEGPFARIVSMTLAEPEYELTPHHIKARAASRNSNPVYELKFDYNFHLSKRDDPIEMRVDFTNLLDYWGEMTNAPASKNKKRSVKDEHLTKAEWHEKVNRAKEAHRLRRRSDKTVDGSTWLDLGEKHLNKRWFGTFTNWLKRLTTFESKEVGYLTLALQKSLLLFSQSTGCIGDTFYASIKMYFDTQLKLDATYAYYFSGTILPPSSPSTYVYFGLEPSAYMGLRLVGNARLQAGTERKKLVDTLSYPGLSVKGLAAVGPTLDLYGQISGYVQLKGEMRAGVKVDFAKTEVYWPQDDDASAQYQQLLGIDATPSSPQTDIAPTFDASVSAVAQIDIVITPQANLGVQIGGTLTGGSIVNAQLYGQVPTDLQFYATAKGTLSSGQASYLVGVYFFYNVAFGAVANILGVASWASGDRMAYNPSPRFTIFEQTGSFGGSESAKRSIDGDALIRYPRRALFDRATISSSDSEGLNQIHVHQSGNNESWSMTDAILIGKRADDSDGGTSMPDFSASQVLTCPPGDSSQVTLPDFRLNCNYFRPQSLQGNGGAASLPGICVGIQRFFQRRGIANSQSVLTWDPFLTRVNSRRDNACPATTCSGTQSALQGIGGSGVQVQCDEYPFASSEEGGNYLSTLAQNPTYTEATCIPAWQNNLQGNCNKIISNLQTNIAYFERQRRGDDATIWALWSAALRTTESAFMNPNQVWTDGNGVSIPQRLVPYPNQIPKAAGITDTQYTSAPNQGEYVGYMFRRNFTFGLASPSGATDGSAWALSGAPPSDWSFTGSNTGGNPGDMSAIACAVNTFDQSDVYRFQFNGLCANGGTRDGTGWGPQASFSRCIIDFSGGGSGSQKKRAIGEYNGWKVYGIKILEDDEDSVEVPNELLLEEQTWIPAEHILSKDLPDLFANM